MKTLKTFQVALVILVLSILVGCSDQITAPTNQVTAPGGSGKQNPKVSETQDLLSVNSFSTRIKLYPNKEYTFNFLNTGLIKFTAIDVEDVSIRRDLDNLAADCQNLSIFGFGNTKYDLALGCHSKGFDVKQITVKNVSRRVLDLSVSLYGVKSIRSDKDGYYKEPTRKW